MPQQPSLLAMLLGTKSPKIWRKIKKCSNNTNGKDLNKSSINSQRINTKIQGSMVMHSKESSRNPWQKAFSNLLGLTHKQGHVNNLPNHWKTKNATKE